MPPGRYTQAALSPDDRTVAVIREDSPSSSDLWLVDMGRAVASRFTFGPGSIAGMLWSPDGKQVAFASDRGDPYGVFVKPTDGSTAEKLLFTTRSVANLCAWAADGKYISFEQLDEHTGWDVWLLPADGSGPPKPYLNGPFNERWGSISPTDAGCCIPRMNRERSRSTSRAFRSPGTSTV
jgi:TolB protein